MGCNREMHHRSLGRKTAESRKEFSAPCFLEKISKSERADSTGQRRFLDFFRVRHAPMEQGKNDRGANALNSLGLRLRAPRSAFAGVSGTEQQKRGKEGGVFGGGNGGLWFPPRPPLAVAESLRFA